MLYLTLFFLSASALICNKYLKFPGQKLTVESWTCNDEWHTACYKSRLGNALEGGCVRGGCENKKKEQERLHGDLKDWECSSCNIDHCNFHTSMSRAESTTPKTSSAASTTRKPSGGNRAATSKSFHVISGDGFCEQYTFSDDCSQAQILAMGSSIPNGDKKRDFTIGECPDKFEKACDMLYKNSEGKLIGSPITISADKTNACGEAKYEYLTKNCDVCSITAGLHSLYPEELEAPSCEVRGSEGFFKDFINKLVDGEPLYLGIAAAVVLIPCLICCCICSMVPNQRVRYISRV